MRELALFAGGGGGILGSELIGLTPRCAVEIDPYARKILLARQRDGMLPTFPIWDNVETFDGRPWRGSIDVITGGFPCKDISAAGRGAGLSGKNSGLFFEMLRIIEEVRPRFVFAENSPNLRTRGLVTIVKEFDRLGYVVRWCVLGAWHLGAPHKRNRMWIYGELSDTEGARLEKNAPRRTGKKFSMPRGPRHVADANGHGLRVGRILGGLESRGQGEAPTQFADDGPKESLADAESKRAGHVGQDDGPRCGKINPPDHAGRARRKHDRPPDGKTLADADGTPSKRGGLPRGSSTEYAFANLSGKRPEWWATEPAVGRVAHGVAHRVDRLKALGNGQVPAVAALAWKILSQQPPDDKDPIHA